MNKVMVQLAIPITGESYDILLPKTLSVLQATELIVSFFKKQESGAYIPDENAALCDMENGRIFNGGASVESLHLRNGTRLMLI